MTLINFVIVEMMQNMTIIWTQEDVVFEVGKKLASYNSIRIELTSDSIYF